ncbi:hypothetical protein [Amycolatopsis sp. NPDC051371]|uniref:hypothetical protein n=1 Tax=Amycolatopsis sp. NPDC051371 TaxID=3155800 RepID=UPI00342CDE90
MRVDLTDPGDPATEHGGDTEIQPQQAGAHGPDHRALGRHEPHRVAGIGSRRDHIT